MNRVDILNDEIQAHFQLDKWRVVNFNQINVKFLYVKIILINKKEFLGNFLL